MTSSAASREPIPAEDLTRQYTQIAGEVHTAIDRVLPMGKYTLGPVLEEFERDYARFCGVDHTIGISSGTAALQLALAAMGVGPGDEVITQANTYVATAFAISYLGATPVFVDVDPVYANLDVAALEGRITPRTKVIIPVHLYGHPVDMDPLMQVARKHGLRVLEDASHAHGATYRGRRTGSLGDAAAFSFYPSKVLGAYGDAGAITTSDASLAKRIRVLRYMGQEVKQTHLMVGYQERLDPIQAAILQVKLRHLEGWIDNRRAIARRYAELLADLAVELPAEAADCRHVYYLYTLLVPRRDELVDFLGQRGIATQTIYRSPVPLQPCYAGLGYSAGDFPVATRLASELINLPMFPELRDDEVQRVAEGVRAFYGGATR
jgi:dTDP-4-amino-4,6-dideoxygalactose transaminase